MLFLIIYYFFFQSSGGGGAGSGGLIDSRLEHVHSEFYNDFEGLFDDYDDLPSFQSITNNSST